MRDETAIHNERIKALAGFCTALGLGLIGFAVLRPAIETSDVPGWANFGWGTAGLAMHGLTHYILGKLKKDD